MPTRAWPPSAMRWCRSAAWPRRRTSPTWWLSCSVRTRATSTATTSWSTAAWPAIFSAGCRGYRRSPAAKEPSLNDRQARPVHDAHARPGPRLRDLPRGRSGGHRPRGPPGLHGGLRRRALQLVERAHYLAAHLPRHPHPAHDADPVRHGRAQPAPDPPGHGGGARGHVRPSLPGALHHGHRPGRARERHRDVRRGPGGIASPHDARIHRDGAQAVVLLADPDNGLSFYYRFFHYSFSQGRKALFML